MGAAETGPARTIDCRELTGGALVTGCIFVFRDGMGGSHGFFGGAIAKRLPGAGTCVGDGRLTMRGAGCVRRSLVRGREVVRDTMRRRNWGHWCGDGPCS